MLIETPILLEVVSWVHAHQQLRVPQLALHEPLIESIDDQVMISIEHRRNRSKGNQLARWIGADPPAKHLAS